MVYVTLVFRKVFGFSREKAESHMLEVHHKGRSIVWSGARERAEFYVQQLHYSPVTCDDRARGKLMEFYSIPGSRLGLRGIPPLLASLMRQIPRLFEQDWSVAEERLFPSPTHDSRRTSAPRGLESTRRT